MGWYDRYVVPRMIACACGCKTVAEQRRKVVPFAHGRVLELGFGAGHNLAFYNPSRVSEVVGIEPSPELCARAANADRPAGLSVNLRQGFAEELPFDDGAFDSVVTTFTLCSVRDQQQALNEARRVLRTGGSLFFAEHGRAPDANIARWQERIEPLWKPLMGGCHLTRQVGAAIRRNFTIKTIEGSYFPRTPRFMGWAEVGEAIAS